MHTRGRIKRQTEVSCLGALCATWPTSFIRISAPPATATGTAARPHLEALLGSAAPGDVRWRLWLSMQSHSEPLLPQNVAGEKATWRHSVNLLCLTSRPRGVLDCARLLVVFVLLVASKLMNITLPLVMRHLVNVLSDNDDDGSFISLSPSALVGTYCGLTIAAEGCVQLQQSVWGQLFYKITQRVSLTLFQHLHTLSMRWHLQRKTGEVLSVINQGVGAVGNLLQIVAFQIFGTALELFMTSIVFYTIGVPGISLCVTAGAALYTGYTVVVTQLRTQQRREQNSASNRSQELVVDSLLNFETVKVFACEKQEADRFDGLTGTLAKLQTSLQYSLSWLNWGQSFAMQLGMAGGLLIACMRTTGGQTTVGDFVMVQLYIVQLFQPLANLGGTCNASSKFHTRPAQCRTEAPAICHFCVLSPSDRRRSTAHTSPHRSYADASNHGRRENGRASAGARRSE